MSTFISVPEICTDGIDNDEDGYRDCEDSGCDNLSCNDNDACTENDICTAGICGGTVIECDDGNECTRNTCEAGQCISECDAASPNDYCCEDQACIPEAICKEDDMRLTDGLVVYYPFTEAGGDVVYDHSNNGTPMDLTITGSVDWNSLDNGVVMSGGKIGTTGSATKVIDALKATGQSTFEIWIESDSLTQDGPARMISIGGDARSQNFVLGQKSDNIQVRLMHTGKNRKARPRLMTNDNFLTTDLIHLVHTYDGTTELLYVNGVPQPATVGSTGNFSNWDDNDLFNLGNEATSDRPWYGRIHLVAVYDHALIREEVEQNFEVGPNDLLLTDTDGDGIPDDEDSCLSIPNGPALGSCYNYFTHEAGETCLDHDSCMDNSGAWWQWCDNTQNDMDADGIGDVCDPTPIP